MGTGGAARISVIIPSYNRADSLPSVLASVLGQTLPPAEVLLVDDGSTDGTPGVVEALLAARPEWRGRLDFAIQANQGKSVALNHALGRATGDWIAFDDSDDHWLPEKLELQMRTLAEFPECGACFTDARFVNNPRLETTAFARAGRSYPAQNGRIDDPVRFVVNPPHGVYMQTLVVRADVMRAAGGFDPRFRVSQDTDFLFRLARCTKLCYVNRPLIEVDRTERRVEGLTTHTGRDSLVRLEIYRTMYEKWRDLAADADPDIRRSIRRSWRGILSEQASYHLRRGDPAAARARLGELLANGFAIRPALKWLGTAIAPGLLRRGIERKARRADPL